MSKYLLDTCSLLWWTLDQDALSKKALNACQSFLKHPGYVSSISVWEIGIKVKNKKLDLGISFEEYVKKLRQVTELEILPVSLDIWIKNIALEWKHRDPADRTIVATAYLNRCSIITTDSVISEFYPKITW